MNAIVVETPVGALRVVAAHGQIVSVGWGGMAEGPETPELRCAREQIAAYFDGRRMDFDLPLQPAPPGLAARTRAALQAIPHGETRSYGDLAKALGVSAQAVGQACGANPLPVIVPCHRVLGANGLGGYSGAGGIETKVALLRHEGAAGLLI